MRGLLDHVRRGMTVATRKMGNNKGGRTREDEWPLRKMKEGG
jgi:hypothetical protein